MALPPYRTPKAPATYGMPGGQSQQNQLYSMLSTNAAQTQPSPADTFQWDPKTVFGTYPGGASTDNGQLPGPNVTRPVQTPGTSAPTPGGSQGNVNNTPASPNPPSGGNSGGGGDQSAIDFSGDPILARIRALNAQNIASAEASALAGRKQAEIGYGYDPNVQYEDQATAEAAQQNPYSTLAQLLFGLQQNDRALGEGLNKSNLFYSGERIRQTGLEGRNYGLQQSQAAGGFQNIINQIAQSVLQAKLGAQEQETQGMSDAYSRALQFALANNTGFGGAGSGGGGGGAGGPNMKDFDYGATIPSGYSDEAIYAAAVAGAPQGATPMHIMNQGQVQNGMISIKYHMPDGTTNTVWVPLPPLQQAAAPPAAAPPATQPSAPPAVVTNLIPSGPRVARPGQRAPQ